MTTVAVGNRRLLKLADILDTADALHRKRGEPTYYQGDFEHWDYKRSCNTPACALGHYAFNCGPKGQRIYWDHEKGAMAHGMELGEAGEIEFAIGMGEYDELFGGSGCDGAKTAKQAAKYIRAFVRRRQK